ncbi:hypothetical protein P4O66_021815, partial [Electrophorus voltai]
HPTWTSERKRSEKERGRKRSEKERGRKRSEKEREKEEAFLLLLTAARLLTQAAVRHAVSGLSATCARGTSGMQRHLAVGGEEEEVQGGRALAHGERSGSSLRNVSTSSVLTFGAGSSLRICRAPCIRARTVTVALTLARLRLLHKSHTHEIRCFCMHEIAAFLASSLKEA